MKLDQRFQNRARLRRRKAKELITTPLPKLNNDFTNRVKIYLQLHTQALFTSLERIFQTPLTSIMTIMVLAIALSSAGGFYVLLNNMEQLTEHLEVSNQISLFLKENTPEREAQALAANLQQNPKIHHIQLISPTQSLAEFKNFSGFGSALDALDSNPLPTVIQIFPKNALDDSGEIEILRNQLSHLAQVDIAQMDMQWVRRLQSIVGLARRGVMLANVLLSFAVLFIMGNTIRLELENRREEVLITKLVGATYGFIQRPFLYTGFWLGFCAGASAWLIVSIMLLILKHPIEQLALLYQTDYRVLFLSFNESALLLLVASTLGVLGAWIVLYYQLEQMKPE
jgi:cell division transport system permease protein